MFLDPELLEILTPPAITLGVGSLLWLFYFLYDRRPKAKATVAPPSPRDEPPLSPLADKIRFLVRYSRKPLVKVLHQQDGYNWYTVRGDDEAFLFGIHRMFGYLTVRHCHMDIDDLLSPSDRQQLLEHLRAAVSKAEEEYKGVLHTELIRSIKEAT